MQERPEENRTNPEGPVYTVAVGFDGVLNMYTGWKGEQELFAMREGAFEFLEQLKSRFRVVIFTTRAATAEGKERVKDWCVTHSVWDFIDDITAIKPKALCHVDDRGVTFTGDFCAVLDSIFDFLYDTLPHWKNPTMQEVPPGTIPLPPMETFAPPAAPPGAAPKSVGEGFDHRDDRPSNEPDEGQEPSAHTSDPDHSAPGPVPDRPEGS